MVRGLKSAKVKLVRAAKHLRAIKKRIAIYAHAKPHKIARKSKNKKKLNIPKSPPAEISLLAGEMVTIYRLFGFSRAGVPALHEIFGVGDGT